MEIKIITKDTAWSHAVSLATIDVVECYTEDNTGLITRARKVVHMVYIPFKNCLFKFINAQS